MGQQFTRLLEPVSQASNERWLSSISPIKGEARAFMVGIAAGAIFHESRFGLAWERRNIMVPLQRALRGPGVDAAMRLLGMFADELMVPYFAVLYWCIDKYKCWYGIWLVPISECLNGCLKWYFRVPRPGWVDASVAQRAWSHEYSFPSSHAQIIWALAAFFAGTSVNHMRRRLYGSWGQTALAYWYFLAAPYAFAALVSLSRVHEGVHYPRDVTVGAGIGVGLASLYMRVLPALKSALKAQPPALRFAALQLVTAAAWLGTRRYHAIAQRAGLNPDRWRTTALAGNPRLGPEGSVLNPMGHPMTSIAGMVGVLFGLGTGQTLAGSVDALRLPLPASRRVAAVRASVGLTGLLGGFLGMRAVEKQSTATATVNVIRFVRHAYIPVWILVLAPMLFNKMEGRSGSSSGTGTGTGTGTGSGSGTGTTTTSSRQKKKHRSS